MALAFTNVTETGVRGSDVATLATEHNNLCDALRAICVILDADAGVTATTLTATLDAAVTKLKNNNGTEL